MSPPGAKSVAPPLKQCIYIASLKSLPSNFYFFDFFPLPVSSPISAGLCTTRAMRPHRAADFRGPPFSLKIDSAEFKALSCN